MPRKLRIQYPGAIYHVLSRGDRRDKIFLDDVDRPVCVRHAQAGRISSKPWSACAGRGEGAAGRPRRARRPAFWRMPIA